MTDQELIQKKIALATSEHAPIIIELMKNCMTKTTSLISKTEWDTVVNAVTLDIQGNMLKSMVDLLEDLKKGKIDKIC